MRPYLFVLFIASFLVFIACESSNKEIVSDIIVYDGTRETAKDITLIQSDSGHVIFRIISPQLDKYEQENKMIEEFPQGLLIEFFNELKEVNSSVYAKYAKRVPKDGTMFLKDSVVFINAQNDQLASSAILWDEVKDEISTTKFFKLIRVANRDTIFGVGMKAKLDFSRFEIYQFEGKRQYRKLTE